MVITLIERRASLGARVVLIRAPEPDPVTMRVQKPTMDTTRMTRYGRETLTGADHPEAATGRRQARLRLHSARGGQGPRDKRGHFPPLEKPLWWDEFKGGQASQGGGVRECSLKELLAEKELVDIDLLKGVNRGNF